MTRKTPFEASHLSEGELTRQSAEKTVLDLDTLGTPLHEAQEILGEDFFGPEEIQKVFNWLPSEIPSIPFSAEELKQARAEGHQLILQIDTFKKGSGSFLGRSEKEVALTIQALKNNFKTRDKHPLLKDTTWYGEQTFYTTDRPRAGWKLVAKHTISSVQRNYRDQTNDIVEYLSTSVFKNSMPKVYADAIEEWNVQKSDIAKLAVVIGDPMSAMARLEKLAITQLVRETPVEVVYRYLVNDHVLNQKLLRFERVWTSKATATSSFVSVGRTSDVGGFADPSLDINCPPISDRASVCFSRMQ